MGKCQVKTGFFVLRTCHARAVTQCPVCKRPICAQHFLVEHKMCTECFSVAHEDEDQDPLDQDLSLKSGGFFSYRRHYYSMHSDLDDLNGLDELSAGQGFEAEDIEAFNAPSEVNNLDDDVSFDDSADLFDS